MCVRKLIIGLLVSFAAATWLCWSGQGIAYYLNEQFVAIDALYYLTGLSIAGFLFYLLGAYFLFCLFKRRGKLTPVLAVIVVIYSIGAVLSSYFALFVTAMWWG